MNYEALELISEPVLIIDARNRLVYANRKSVNFFHLPEKYAMKSAGNLLKDSKWLPRIIFDLTPHNKHSIPAEDVDSALWNITIAPAEIPGKDTVNKIVTFHDISKMEETFINHALIKWWDALSSHLSSRIIYSLDMDFGSLQFAGDVTNLTGYSLEELTSFGMNGFLDLIHPDDRHSAKSKTDMVLSSISDVCLEYRFKRKDGQYIHISDTCALVTDLGEKPFRFVGTIKEITQRKMEYESLSKGLDEARESDRAKTRFLAMISHEMRTPLHSIKGIAGMLDEESTDKRSREMVSLLKSSCDVLKRLIDDASDIALIEEGRMRINNESVSIPDLMLYIDKIYSGRFAANGLGFSMNTSQEVPDHISGDSNRIIQIFINIMDNALKYTLEGNVSISITLNADRSKILFEFIDTGIGIPQKRLNEIFKPFNIADDSNRKHARGTGLGLAISKRLAMLMGGDISVESREGKGSRFLLNLPLIRPDKKTDNEHGNTKKTPGLHSMNILAVDDIPENIELLKLYFSDLKLTLIESLTGKEAIELYKSHDPDCVLLDMYLPDISGEAVAIKIREYEKSAGKKRTPIIGITADCMKEHIQKALDAGCDMCLIRPVEKIELFNQISSILTKTGREEVSTNKKPDEIEYIRQMSLVRIKKIASELLIASQENDFTQARRLGHALTGLGMTFGFEHIEETGREIIKSAQDENSGNIMKLASRITDSIS